MGRNAFECLRKLVKALKVGEEVRFRCKAVNDAHGIVDVVGCRQTVACVLDGAHMARGDVASGANQCKIFHGFKVCKR